MAQTKDRSTLYAEYPPEERAQLLNDNADFIKENHTIKKEFTPEELAAMREQYTEESMVLGDIASEFEVIKSEFKGKMKPIIKKLDMMLGKIRARYEDIKGTAYFLSDQKEGKMYVYNALGELIEERRLRPEEKQGSLFNMEARKTA